MRVLTTFGQRGEFDKARAALDWLGLPYEVLSPAPAYERVGVPCLVMAPEARHALAARTPQEFVCAGWVDYRPAADPVPPEPPAVVAQDVLGEVAVMVLAPCVSDAYRIRLVAHIGGDLAPVLPYLNADMPQAIYNARIQALTFMEGYRLVTLYQRRITIAKADEIIDAWRLLGAIRLRVADVWARRATLQPSAAMHAQPPVIEIFKRLPRTNCRACGERTCLAFAARVHAGELPVTSCLPVFEGDFGHLQDALLACAFTKTG